MLFVFLVASLHFPVFGEVHHDTIYPGSSHLLRVVRLVKACRSHGDLAVEGADAERSLPPPRLAFLGIASKINMTGWPQSEGKGVFCIAYEEVEAHITLSVVCSRCRLLSLAAGRLSDAPNACPPTPALSPAKSCPLSLSPQTAQLTLKEASVDVEHDVL